MNHSTIRLWVCLWTWTLAGAARANPPKGDTPGFFIGLMDEVKIWTRALSAEEVRKEHEARRGTW